MDGMDPQRWATLKDAFARLVEHPPQQRAALLDDLCRDDEGLRRELESLLQAHDDTGQLIQPDGFGLAAAVDAGAGLYVGRRFGPYRILREIGRGGMGTVFLAERADGEFHRQVALKVVRRSFADRDLARRFRRERQILASLSHPNVAHLLDGGVSADGEPFLVMEHVGGVRIDEYCAGAGLATRERLTLFLKVCEAVAYAHDRSIVHRDLKPSNILVTADGIPKLLDFGIAKLIEAEESGEHTVTAYRAFTPDYAAPEQVSGAGPPTTASDVFSLGVLLATLVGVPDASGPGGDAGGTATRTQRRLTRELGHIVAMARHEDPSRRYRSARELGLDLQRHLDGLPVRAQPDSLGYRAAKFIERRGHLLAASAAGAALTAAIVGALVLAWGSGGPGAAGISRPMAATAPGHPLAGVKTIAVLPLKSLAVSAAGGNGAAGAEGSDQALRVGMADSVVTALSRVPQLAVRPTSATVRYLDTDYDAVRAGRELQVDSVLEGTLQRVDDELRINLQLVDVAYGRVVWADSFSSDLAHVLRGQESLAHRVSQLLALSRTSAPAAEGRASQGSANLAAQDAYLRGSLALNMAVRQVPAILSARDAFEQAIRLDPAFAAAHAGLATAYTMAGSLTLLPPQEAYPRAERAARRALELDREIAVAYVALAEVEADYNWNWPAAEANNRRALELAPNSAAAHHSYAEFLARLGRFGEAATHSDLATQLDPTRVNYLAVRALHYYLEQRFDDAIAQANRALDADPDTYLAHLYISVAHAARGEPAEGIEAARRAAALTGGAVPDLFVLGCNYAVANDRVNAGRVLERLVALSRGRYVDPFHFVAIYAYLGERDRAFEFLERSYAERSYWMTTLKVHPVVNALRADPRFAEMIRRMKLD